MANPNENTGRWSNEEHDIFINGLREHGKEWKVIAALVETRTVVQIRTHAQKYFQKLSKRGITDPVGYIRGGNATPFDGVKRPREAEPRTPRKSVVSSPRPHRSRRSSSDASSDPGAPQSSAPRSKLGRPARRQSSASASAGGPSGPTSGPAAAAAAPAPTRGTSSPRAFHAVQERPATGTAVVRVPTGAASPAKGVKRRHGALVSSPLARHRPRVMHSSRPPPPPPPREALRRHTGAASIPLVEVAPVPEQAPPSTTFVRLPVLNDYAGSAREYGVDSSYPIPDDALLASAAPGDGILGLGDTSPTSVCDVLYSFPAAPSAKHDRASPLMSVPDPLAGSWLGAQGFLTGSDAARCAVYPSSGGHGPVKRQRTSYVAAPAHRGGLVSKAAPFALEAHDFDVDEYVEGFLAAL